MRAAIKRIASCVYDFAANAPQLQVEIDRNKARALQVPVDDVLNTMQNYLGAIYRLQFAGADLSGVPASRHSFAPTLGYW